MEKIIPTPYRASRFWTAIAAVLLSAAVVAQPGDGRGWQEFERPVMGKGHPFSIADLPRGRLRERLESMPWSAREQAMRWLHRFSFPARDLESMEIDDDGAVRYVEPAPVLCAEPPCPGPGVPARAEGPGIDEPEFAAGESAADGAFLLHSRPGSPNVVFLDFDGLVVTGTAWNGSTDPLDAKPFDLDGNPGDFSPSERAVIAEIWHRVAEDLAPFDIDVTTEEPLSFDRYTGRILITSGTDANGADMPSGGGGGVAYVGVWGAWNYATRYSPVLVYYDNLAKNATYIAESAAHEFGHNLGLSHDGSGGSTYYSGHGSGNTSWAPIMGNAFGKNVSQWSKGEYAGANNSQDDIAIIAGELGWVDDDHNDSLGGATPLQIDASGSIQVSNPETDPYNDYPDNKGIIETADDWDYFSLDAAAGALDITVNPAWEAFYRTSKRGANLDLQAVLLDAGGNILASSDPTDATHASIATTVTTGTYYLAVTGVGSSNYSDYASQGMYFIGGSVTLASDPNDPPLANFGSGCAGLDCSFNDASSDSDGTIVDRSWAFGDGQGSIATAPGHTYAAAGTYSVSLTVTDDDGATGTTTQSVTVTVPNVPPTATFTANCTDLSCSFNDTSSDSDGTIATWSWAFGDGQGSNAIAPGHDYTVAGTYTVTLTVTDDDGATATTTRTVTATVNGGAQDDVQFDFGGDGRADILIRNKETGWISLWEMDGHQKTPFGVGRLDLDVQIVGVADLTGDGKADIVRRNQNTGWVSLWEMDGNLATFYNIGSLDLNIEIVGMGDLNGDGKTDIVRRNKNTGWVSLWEMDGNQKTAFSIGPLSLDVEIVGVADLTGDGKADIVRRNRTSGFVSLWEMDGNLASYRTIGPLELDVEIVGMGDLNRDGKADIVRRNKNTGWVSLWEMDGNQKTQFSVGQLDLDVEIVSVADLTGDGKADIVRRNKNTGWVSLWEMDGNLATFHDIGELNPVWAVQ